MVIENIIQNLESLYKNLMTKDLTPDEESQAKVQLLEFLSSIKAYTEVQGGSQAKNILTQTNSLKDLLLGWDPYGSAWFKEDKTLVNSVYDLLASVKTLTIQSATTSSAGAASNSAAINELRQYVEGVITSLRTQIMNLESEVSKIKATVIVLAKTMKSQMETQQNIGHQIPKPPSPAVQQKPVSLNTPAVRIEAPIAPKPVPVVEPKPVSQSTISLPKPVPLPIPLEPQEPEKHPSPFISHRTEPISIPKPEPIPTFSPGPQPIPLDEVPFPSPIPLSKPNFEEPIPLEPPPLKTQEDTPLFGGLTASKKEAKKKQDKEQLFSFFSGGASSSAESGSTVESEEFELVEDTSEGDFQPAPYRTQAAAGTDSDPETLYQELISLEGKRYSIERSIRDLKTDRENGILSDQEYKEKLSQLLNKLQSISKRIESIREKID